MNAARTPDMPREFRAHPHNSVRGDFFEAGKFRSLKL